MKKRKLYYVKAYNLFKSGYSVCSKFRGSIEMTTAQNKEHKKDIISFNCGINNHHKCDGKIRYDDKSYNKCNCYYHKND